MKARLVTGDDESIPMKDMEVGSFAQLNDDPGCTLYRISNCRAVIICAGSKEVAMEKGDYEVNGWENVSLVNRQVIPLKSGDKIEIV